MHLSFYASDADCFFLPHSLNPLARCHFKAQGKKEKRADAVRESMEGIDLEAGGGTPETSKTV